MCVVVASDSEEARLATIAAADRDGPVYLRLSRYETPIWREADRPLTIGEAEVRRAGSDVTVAACGVVLGRVLEAAEMLEKDGISAEVLNVHTIKPLDAAAILSSCEKTGAVLTVEEQSIIGGLGSAVAEALAEQASRRIPLRRIGVRDTFGESGTADELLEKHGLTARNIAAQARSSVKLKK
jgi:transketolase